MKARFFALAALVLGMVSCQQDFDAAPQVGGEVDFQLKVDAVELATRAGDIDGKPQNAWDSAYGAIDYLQGWTGNSDEFRVDWNEVDLRYSLEVYDADVDYASDKVFPVKDRQVIIVDEYKQVTFDLRLVPNRDYRFVVFADFVPQGAYDDNDSKNPAISAQKNLGLYHVIGDDLRDITIKNDAINAECTDAYFASKIITIENSAAKDIVLTRPYGKVRVIATDLAELNINVDPAYVKVFYTAKHPQAFNAVTGDIDTYEENVEYEFLSKYAEEVSKNSLANHYYTAGYDAIKAENANGVKRHTHMTLFTDYILAADEQEAIHFSMEVYDKKGGLIKQTYFNTDIPVKRNNLTTIVGNVLTTATEINVTIDDNFANYIEKPVVFVSTAKELQEALNAYVDGQTILFDADIKAEDIIKIKQNADVNVVIDGNGYKFDGGFYVDGLNRYTGEETLTFQNINFETTRDGLYFIDSNVAKEYAHNVTVKNCTFKGNETVVGARLRQAFDIKFEGCEANGIHSLAQCYGVAGIVVDNVKTNTKNGVSLGTSTDAVVKNSTIVATGYGLRVDADGARTLVVEKSTIKAFLPVVARKASANYTINFGEGNVLEAPGYDVVFTKGDDEATFVAPAEYTITGANNFKVFPRDNYNFVYTADDLKAAVAAGGDYLLMPTTIEGKFDINKPVILKGLEGATIKGRLNISENATGSAFKGIRFTINDDSKVKYAFTGAPYQYPAIVNVQNAATTFEGCYFETNIGSAVCGINYGNALADRPLTVTKCKFEGSFYPIRSRVAFNITENEFVSTYNGDGLCAVWAWGINATNTSTYASKAIFSNNKAVAVSGKIFNGVQATASNYAFSNVEFTVEDNVNFTEEFVTNPARDYTKSTLNGAAIVASVDEIASALTADKADVRVVLAKDIDLPISKLGQQTGGSGEYKLGGEQTENITIDLNGYKLNITTTYWSGIGAKNDKALFTIKNGTMTSSQSTGTWNSYDLTFANCNYVIEDVVFDKAIAFTNAGKEVALNDVVINETHDYYAMWISAKGQTVNIDGLTINSAGRGIKIDEQYVDAPATVTLNVANATFTTAKKAAIMVKSAAGAEINVDNLDITGVAADKVNAVWVDADAKAYADKVTVKGCTMIVE